MAKRQQYLDPEARARFLQAIRVNAPYVLACQYAGWSIESWRRWRIAAESRKGKGKTSDPLVEFVDAVMRAEADAAMRGLVIIEQAAVGLQRTDEHGNVEQVRDPDWRAAAWKLERRYPADFGKRAMEISGPDSGPLQVVARHLPELPDDLLNDILTE